MGSEEEIKGSRAKQILEDPLVVAAFDALEAAAYREFKRPDLSDADVKETWMIGQMAIKFRSVFESHIKDAELAAHVAEMSKRERFRP